MDFKYLSLHVHSIKSVGDAILKIDDYIKKAIAYDLKSLCLTNHGTMSDSFEFYKKCKSNDIKPIIGCEVYITNDRLEKTERSYDHLVLIAINKIGFQNLLAIHNDAQVNGFYYKPRTDVSVLEKHGEGIIALSACVGGTLPKMILKSLEESLSDPEFNEEEHTNRMLEYISLYKSIFHEFYLEIQPGKFANQIAINEALVELANETNTKLIITNDVHYLNAEDYLPHNIHVCAGQKKEATDDILYPDKCYYVMSTKEIIDSLLPFIDRKIIDTALSNIQDIENMVEDYDIIPKDIYMPDFIVPEGHTEDTFLEEECFVELNVLTHKIDDMAEYTERLLYELDVIRKLRFSGYFLTVQDYVMLSLIHI